MVTSKEQMIGALNIAMSTGGDFAEFFFEEQDETLLNVNNGTLEGIRTKHIKGVGLYLLSGTRSIYVYSNDDSISSLMDLAKKSSEMMKYIKGQAGASVFALNEKKYHNANTIIEYPANVPYKDKIKVINEAYKSAASAGDNLLNVDVRYFDRDRRIKVVNSEGLITGDRRVTSQLRFAVTCGGEDGSFYDWDDFTRPQGFEAFRNNDDYKEFAKDMVKSTEAMRKAEPMSPGIMPVVFEAGECGTFWHECCGHTLEATAIASRKSFFVDKIGQKVANDKVTLIDDGTMAGYYGTDAIDDEGHKRQKNILIEKGILKSYLCDRLHGKMIGMKSTGNGRRQDYTYAPVSRMTNTYLAPGTDEEDEIIRSVPNGLYVKSLGGGDGGTQFSIQVKEGFLIKNGQIDRQVKGVMLTGNGAKVMNKVDRVGKTLGYDSGSFCGASSGLVPVTAMQPMVRVSEMNVG